MEQGWIKRLLPRSLYGRAALILVVPILTLQLVVSIVFIQRHFDGVTRQLTASTVREIDYVLGLFESGGDVTRGLEAAMPAAQAFGLTLVAPPQTAIRPRIGLFDFSGRAVRATLIARLDGIKAVDLQSGSREVRMLTATALGEIEVRADRRRMSASNPHQLLVLMIVTGLLMTIIAFLFLRNQLRPIKRLSRASEAFGRGVSMPYRPSGAIEVRAAGSAFLNMRARIERQIEQRTMMLSGVSHDLRTPLTRLKLGLSLMPQDSDTEALQKDVADMESMLDTFLDFARLEALEDPEQTDPAALVTGLVDQFQAAGSDVETGEISATDPVMLRPASVERALQNLIGNGLRYGTRVRVGCQPKGRMLCFVVEDDGPGIPADQRDEAIKAFSRLDRARNQDRGGGVGLGLAIVSDIARSHGGHLRLTDSAELGGLRAEFSVAQ